jgi:hypothetical protein
MSNDIGKETRAAFLEILEEMGTECQAGGESRKAMITENKQERTYAFCFADEFAVKPGDKIKNWVTETNFTVIRTRSLSAAGSFHYFEVTAK